MTQNHEGALYVVATPIGNLEDISARALRLLGEADLIAAEDTRHSARLLDYFGIRGPLMSLHEHNEASRIDTMVARIEQGQNIALISDAGTPLISDPGYRQTLTQYKGEALSLLNQPLEAARTLITLQNDTDDTDLNDVIWRQVARLDDAQLNTLSGIGGWSAGWVSLAQVTRDQGGDLQQLFNAVSRWQQSRPSHPASRRLPNDLAALGNIKGHRSPFMTPAAKTSSACTHRP